MITTKERAYIAGRTLLGLGLIATVVILVWRGPAEWDVWPLWLVIYGSHIGLGIATLFGRARASTLGLCLIVGLFLISFGAHREFWGALYVGLCVAGAIFLLLPKPIFQVRDPPAEPGENDWRPWLLASLQGEGIQPARDRFHRGFAVRVGVVLAGFVTTFALGWLTVVLSPSRYENKWHIVFAIIAAFVLWNGIDFLTGGKVRRLERLVRLRMQAKRAQDELHRSGARRPVLYLRAFEIDRATEFEEALVARVRKLGPVIAIGRPGEALPPLGAARFYVDDAHWRQKVADVVRVAQFVVWTSGTSEGLRWELTHLITSLAPEKLILWAHPHLLGLDKEGVEAEWSRFVALLGSAFPQPLPERLEGTRFFVFGTDWKWTAYGADAGGSERAIQAASLRHLLREKAS